jgi:hypothetical protein
MIPSLPECEQELDLEILSVRSLIRNVLNLDLLIFKSISYAVSRLCSLMLNGIGVDGE